ncbi:unnamed protein product [Owenia fusiformis]|uniref:Uncharacterized protein n=1 Tax=Owenia fusiformis TaxID=6347 RepID=A0A8J1XRI8_OWEFU|nr:unnamed protein product [Owenia fusiformis]
MGGAIGYYTLVVLVSSAVFCGSRAKSVSVVVHHEETFAIADLHEDQSILERLSRERRSPDWDSDWDEEHNIYANRIENNQNIYADGHSPKERKRRSPGWSPDDFDDESNWEVSYTTPRLPVQTAAAGSDVEILPPIGGPPKEEKVTIGQIITYAAAPIGLIAMTILIYCFYRCCIARDCICCEAGKNRMRQQGQNMVQDYVPGAQVGKDGKVEFVKPTDEEMEALKGAVRELM